MFGTRDGVRLRIGVLMEVTDSLGSTRVRWLHLSGPDGKRVCGYVHLIDEGPVPSLPCPSAVIQCTKCLAQVRIAPQDRPQLLEAYRESLDPLSKSERHATGLVEFIALSPLIVAPASRAAHLPVVPSPRPQRPRLPLVPYQR